MTNFGSRSQKKYDKLSAGANTIVVLALLIIFLMVLMIVMTSNTPSEPGADRPDSDSQTRTVPSNEPSGPTDQTLPPAGPGATEK